MWDDEVTAEREGSIHPVWIFRYLCEKWIKKCVEPRTRTLERRISRDMIGGFMGQKYGHFLLVLGNPESARGDTTAISIILVFDTYVMDIWDDMVREAELEGEVIYLIIDNARNYLPVFRWFLEKGVVLKHISLYSPDLNPIEHIWSLIENILQKHYPKLYLITAGEGAKKKIEEAFTHCWEMLDSKIFDTLAESMVDRVQAVIEVNEWYTKYECILETYFLFYLNNIAFICGGCRVFVRGRLSWLTLGCF